MKPILPLFIFLSFAFVLACDKNQFSRHNGAAQNAVVSNKPPKSELNPNDAVQVSVEPVMLKAGGTSEAVIKVKIQPPFHINANPPSEKNLIPTEVKFTAQNLVSPENAIYPAGESKKFQFSEKPLSIYDGEIEIKLPLKASANAAKSEQTLNGKLRFQPCDDEVCYRPQTVDVKLTVKIV